MKTPRIYEKPSQNTVYCDAGVTLQLTPVSREMARSHIKAQVLSRDVLMTLTVNSFSPKHRRRLHGSVYEAAVWCWSRHVVKLFHTAPCLIVQRASRFNVQLNTIIDLSDTRPSCNLSLHVNHNSRGEDKSFQAIDCAIVDKLMRLTCVPFNSLKHCTRSSVLHAAVCRQPTAACTDCRCLSAASVTGQLADTPTRGLPTRGLVNSRMPLATLRA